VSVSADATRRLALLFGSRTGIDLERGNQGPSLGRFVLLRMKELGLPSVDAYLEVLDRADSPELVRLINATTIGLSWLFRDAEQLAAVGQLLDALPRQERPLEIWVPGCARGEDVYSLAMLAASCGRPVSILGTDINSDFLAHADRGQYGTWSCRHVPARLSHYLSGHPDGSHSVAPVVRRSVRFARSNLLEPPPVPLRASAWDVVLCRNVLIYFHAAHATATVVRLADALSDDGWLFLGANESWSAGSLRAVSFAGRVAFRRGDLPPPRFAGVFFPPPPAPEPAAVEPEPPPPATASAAQSLLLTAGDRHVEGRFSEALTLYSQVLATAPLLNEAHMLLGVTHYMMGDHAAAAQALRAALFLDSDLWPAAFYLALSHDKLGNRVEAARAYRQVLAAAQKPQTFSTVVLEQLGVWKADIVQLARSRGGRVP
jgi:chemotaxis protein methyltransferase CheR